MSNRGEGLFQEVDVITLIRKISTRNKVVQAKILQRLETVVDPSDYPELRKFILDELNGLIRSFVREAFGNLETLIK